MSVTHGQMFISVLNFTVKSQFLHTLTGLGVIIDFRKAKQILFYTFCKEGTVMFDFSIFQDLKAEGINKELIEGICQRIQQKEDQMHEQSANWGVYLTPNTFNK